MWSLGKQTLYDWLEKTRSSPSSGPWRRGGVKLENCVSVVLHSDDWGYTLNWIWNGICSICMLKKVTLAYIIATCQIILRKQMHFLASLGMIIVFQCTLTDTYGFFRAIWEFSLHAQIKSYTKHIRHIALKPLLQPWKLETGFNNCVVKPTFVSKEVFCIS